MKLYIKNMACDCCKVLVKEEIEKLGLKPINIDIGEAEIKGHLTEKKQEKLNNAIKKAGLEIIENKKGILLEKIKISIHKFVNNTERQSLNFSKYLITQLPYDYAYLSNFFSTIQAATIEQYLIAVKIDKAKELIVIHDLTLSEIADKLHYSSVAHLSAQFKKVTGLTPSHYKKLRETRNNISSNK